jgi:hypothetical protein
VYTNRRIKSASPVHPDPRSRSLVEILDGVVNGKRGDQHVCKVRASAPDGARDRPHSGRDQERRDEGVDVWERHDLQPRAAQDAHARDHLALLLPVDERTSLICFV